MTGGPEISAGKPLATYERVAPDLELKALMQSFLEALVKGDLHPIEANDGSTFMEVVANQVQDWAAVARRTT